MSKRETIRLPQGSSIIMACIVAIVTYFGDRVSPHVGYFLALLYMLLLCLDGKFAWWPKKNQSENKYVFAAFWGISLGLILPFVLSEYVFSI